MDKISYQALYSRRADPMRLGDALDIHYDLNPQFTRWEKFKSPEAKGLVRAHDISHLLFGCDTGLLGEMQVQLWSKFAVQSPSWADKIRYARDKESRILIRNPIGYRRMLQFFVKNFTEVKRIRLQAAKMTRKWEYFKEDLYLEVALGDIRTQYGIEF
jgi:hypothetical protein